ITAWFMLRPAGETPSADRRASGKIVIEGLVVGGVTGFVGVGGGFLIVPALVLLGGLLPHLAIGTSLMIIALKSGAALVKYLGVLANEGLSIDWSIVATFIAAGTIGSLFGGAVAHRLRQETLRRAFGYFVVVMGVVILLKTL
ncbi:MAG: sulfite exporter TauE/SafE family protein, partial [Planctomycetota bacterium]|nr:sulfite exporter TauE/SafE family protein [Planctomycetota bacterium]